MRNPRSILEADFDTVRRLFTVVKYADRFNAALLPHLFSKGFVQNLLVRLRELSA
jgi:hypothetical protein